jgi:hypothetical protein
MAGNRHDPSPPNVPADLAEFIAAGAAWEADLVGHALATSLPPEQARLPADVLLNLGAALRLLAWEHDGLTLHRDAGLPSADDAIRWVLVESLPRRGRRHLPDAWLCVAVLRLRVEHFAWAGPRELRADVRLDAADEDALIDALAQLLWKHRHADSAGDAS